MKMNKLFLFLFLSIFLISFVFAASTTEINYELQIKYQPYCTDICSSNIVTNSTTNQITNTTTCTQNCYWVLNIRGLPSDKHNILPSKINTSSETFSGKEGEWISLYGIYYFEVGNLTDITGINEKLNNLNITVTNLEKCQATLLEYNTNLTQCYDQTGGNTNYSLSECTVDKETISNNLDDKISQIDNLNEELNKQKSNKILLIILAFVGGIAAIKWGLPFIQDKTVKKDPLEKGKRSYSEY